ncbi:AAA family ATPase, partial [bacterium]|nr:AAA family ATPase [bacterium]
MAKINTKKYEVPAAKLRWRCDEQSVPFASTKEVEAGDKVIGQDRAVEALEVGLTMRAPGFNVFVSGPAGTCKLSSVRKILDQLPAKKRPGQDIVYLNNFTNPREPMAAKLPAGDGARLKKEMRHFVEELKSSVPSLFDHKEYKARRDELLGEYRQRQRTLFRELEQEIRDRGFAMVQVQMGQFTRPAILPLIENQPTPFEQLEQATENGNFPRTRLEQLQERQQELQGRLEAVMKEARVLDREVRDKVRELERTLAAAMLEGMVDELRGRFTHEKLVDYFDRMREFTLENLDRFKGDDETEAANPFAAFAGQMGPETDPFLEWEVNVLVDNSGDGHKPVIVENSPTYSNLFGTIEKVVTRTGQWATDFTKLRAGSILRADGGYIVFNILDAITEPGVWKTLKRLIKTREFQLETYDAFWFFMNSGIKPEPIEIDVKFIVVGEPSLYHMLYSIDEDFKKLFKIR